MEEQKNPKNTKKIVLAVVALIAAVAVLLGVYAATRKPAQAGTKTITVDVVLTDGSDTVSTLTTDAEYLRGALEEAGMVEGSESEYGLFVTTVNGVTADDAIMQEEIFGPVLPVIAYDSLDEAVGFVNGREHPLALYLFSEDKRTQERFLKSVPFGGGCINDTIIHLATSRMGFGGVGNSGMGSYHGKKSFDTFSHEKSIVDKSTWMDLPVRYMPYSPIKDKLLRVFLR